MSESPPSQVLHREHEAIRQLLHALRGMAGALREGLRVDRADGDRAIDAVTGFADKFHHAKEEAGLFPTLMDSRQAAFAKGLVPLLEREHGVSRRLVSDMKGSVRPACDGDARAIALFGHAASQYAQLQETHIRREERELLPLADAMAPRNRAAVAKAWARLDARAGPGAWERFLQEILFLTNKYARYAEPAVAATA